MSQNVFNNWRAIMNCIETLVITVMEICEADITSKLSATIIG